MLKPVNQQQNVQLKIFPGSRVFGYARVSTYYQKVYGTSLEAQRAKIEKYCDVNNLTIFICRSCQKWKKYKKQTCNAGIIS